MGIIDTIMERLYKAQSSQEKRNTVVFEREKLKRAKSMLAQMESHPEPVRLNSASDERCQRSSDATDYIVLQEEHRLPQRQ